METSGKTGGGRITIRDVARRAGVGVGTVSRVLNNHPLVSKVARAAVESAIAELEYKPNAIAQNLRRSSSKTIGIVVPNLSNPFFAELVQATEEAARVRNNHVYLMNSLDDPSLERECIASLEARNVDGILLIPASSRKIAPSKRGTPIILVDRLPKGHPGISADHSSGARLAVTHLQSLGHQRIAIIAGPKSTVPAQARLDGFLSIMAPVYEALGLDIGNYLFSGPFNMETGRLGLLRFMNMPFASRPTAIFACADQQAIGALRAAWDSGLAVPQDLSIVGYDGILVSEMVIPRLTTVVQPVVAIAEAAVDAILDAEPRHGQSLFECRLREGESARPPRSSTDP